MNKKTTQETTQATKQEWTTPTLDKIDITKITKSGGDRYATEDAFTTIGCRS